MEMQVLRPHLTTESEPLGEGVIIIPISNRLIRSLDHGSH